MATENAEHLIEIRVDRLAQLFHTLDPFPFREKDLDQDAEEYIVSWRANCQTSVQSGSPSISRMATRTTQIPKS